MNYGFAVHRIVSLHSLSAAEMGLVNQLQTHIEGLLKVHPGIKLEAIEITSKAHFQSVTNRIAAEAPKLGCPLIHLDMHGHKTGGLAINDGAWIDWKTVKSQFRKINRRTKNEMAIVSCVCDALNAILPAEINKPAPFSVYFAPSEKIYESDIETTVHEFYTELLAKQNATEAAKVLANVMGTFCTESSMFNALVMACAENNVLLNRNKLGKHTKNHLCGRRPHFTANDINQKIFDQISSRINIHE